MAYRICFERGTKSELDKAASDYGPKFSGKLHRWLRQLARMAERREAGYTVDLSDLVETVLSGSLSTWKYSWSKWKDSDSSDRIRAFLTLIRKRCPPWECRAASRTFRVIEAFDASIVVFYEIDHSHSRIVIRLFDGLPGQG